MLGSSRARAYRRRRLTRPPRVLGTRSRTLVTCIIAVHALRILLCSIANNVTVAINLPASTSIGNLRRVEVEVERGVCVDPQVISPGG